MTAEPFGVSYLSSCSLLGEKEGTRQGTLGLRTLSCREGAMAALPTPAGSPRYERGIMKDCFLIFYLFLEKEKGRRKRETSMCGCLLCAPYWGPGPQPRPDWESNWRPFGLQAGAQPMEPRQPGRTGLLNKCGLHLP